MSTATNPPKPHVEEDVDDLDDVLEEFNAPPAHPALSKSGSTSSANPPPAATTSAASQPPPSVADEDFAAEFARQMESVLLDLGGGVPAPSASGAKDKEEEKKREDTFKAAWEAMLVDGMDGLVDLDGFNGKASASNDAESVEDAFQKSVRQAMERLKASEDTLQADASAGQEDELEKLLASLGEGGGDDDALHGILEGMMGQLMSKDVLYEPLKELNEKFPEYLATNATKLPADDLARYKAQQASVSKIIVLFDDPSYSDSDATKGAEIVNLMSEMQSHGSPPAEIMGPMPPGLDLGADGIPKVPDGCTIS